MKRGQRKSEGEEPEERHVKLMRDAGESRGRVQGMMDVDHIEEEEWQECHEKVRARRKPLEI